MKLEIGFGTTPQIVELPDKNIEGILYPNEVTVATTCLLYTSPSPRDCS